MYKGMEMKKPSAFRVAQVARHAWLEGRKSRKAQEMRLQRQADLGTQRMLGFYPVGGSWVKPMKNLKQGQGHD